MGYPIDGHFRQLISKIPITRGMWEDVRNDVVNDTKKQKNINSRALLYSLKAKFSAWTTRLMDTVS